MQSLITSLLGYTSLSLLSTGVTVAKFSFSFIYPLFRSIRIARGKEPDENKLRLLKFWVIYAIMYLIVYWIQSLLDLLEVTDIALACVYFVFIFNNFSGSDWAYDNMVTQGFGMCEKQLHGFFKTIRKLFENTVYGMLMAVKEIFFAFLAGVIPMLPGPLKYFLDFSGITKMLEGSLDRQKDYETSEKAKADRKAKQRQIEQNRPESPSKKDRLSFTSSGSTPGAKKDKVDITTKQPVDGARPSQRKKVQEKVDTSTGKKTETTTTRNEKKTVPQGAGSAAPAPGSATKNDKKDDDEYSDDGKALQEKNRQSPTRVKKTVVGGAKK